MEFRRVLFRSAAMQQLRFHRLAPVCESAEIRPRPADGSRESEPAEHYQRVDETLGWMVERPRQPPDHLEPQRLPQPDRADIGADDEVELHRPKAARFRMVDRMQAHRPRDPATRRRRARHIPRVAHMPPAARPVAAQLIGPICGTLPARRRNPRMDGRTPPATARPPRTPATATARPRGHWC